MRLGVDKTTCSQDSLVQYERCDACLDALSDDERASYRRWLLMTLPLRLLLLPPTAAVPSSGEARRKHECHDHRWWHLQYQYQGQYQHAH
jgi:hypothetical protein